MVWIELYYSSLLVSSGSVAVHPDASVQLLAEEATAVENLDSKVKQILFFLKHA